MEMQADGKKFRYRRASNGRQSPTGLAAVTCKLSVRYFPNRIS